MIQKIENIVLQLRYWAIGFFLIASLIFTIVYGANASDEEEYPNVISFCPPDVVPHMPPHFPEPKLPGDGNTC